jgi:hypothetical protein
MVKIRYAELPAGLHVDARTHYGDTVVYLLPGLTTDQRRAALTRVRSSGRMGRGPRLSATSMAVAVGTDRVRTTASTSAAAVRGHPVLLLPSLVVMSGTFFALVSLIALVAKPAARGVEAAAGLRSPHVGTGSHVVGRAAAPSHTATAPNTSSSRIGRHRARNEAGIATRYRGRHEFPDAASSARGLQGTSPSPAALPASQCVVLGTFGVCWTG